jgi:hypothetical protein
VVDVCRTVAQQNEAVPVPKQDRRLRIGFPFQPGLEIRETGGETRFQFFAFPLLPIPEILLRLLLLYRHEAPLQVEFRSSALP